MKDGRTHLAHKVEQGVDLETGAILSVTVQDASAGDSATLPETVTMAAEQRSRRWRRTVRRSKRWSPTRATTATRRDDLYWNAGMRRPPLAAARMVLSEARCNNTVYPMGSGRGSEAGHTRQRSNRDRDTALSSWAAGLERSAQASARSNVNSQKGMHATAAGMEYPGRVRSRGAGLLYG